MFRRLLFLIILLVIFCACHHYENNSNRSYNLEKVDTFSLPLPNDKSQNIRSLQFYISKIQTKSYLACVFHKDTSIYIYDLEKSLIADTININLKFGRGINGFDILSQDSIYITVRKSNKVLLVDKNGQILNRWVIEDTTSNIDYRFGSNLNSLKVASDKVFGMRKVSVRRYSDIYNFTPEVIYSLQKGNILNYTGEWPQKYKASGFWHFVGSSYGRALSPNNKIIISFPVDHHLYIYSSDSLVKKVKVPSRYLGNYNFPSFDKSKRTQTGYKLKYVSTLGRYNRLLFDPYRNVYYRLCLHPQKFNNEDGSQNMHIDRAWSIMVLDTNFNILTEKKFPPKKFNFRNVAVIDKGILVSNNHEARSNYQPNKLSFTLFELQKDDS